LAGKCQKWKKGYIGEVIADYLGFTLFFPSLCPLWFFPLQKRRREWTTETQRAQRREKRGRK
jgi:hypothetical protein